MTANGNGPGNLVDGHNSHYTYSPTAISFAPSDSVTLSAYNGPIGENTNRTMQEKRSVTDIPNVTVPVEHKNRTLVLCFDGTGDQ